MKESLKQDNFFLKNIDAQGREEHKSSIKIQIHEEPHKQEYQPDTISPLSGASSEIKHGGMSLSPESSTSGENREKLQAVIAEIAKFEKEVEESPLNKNQRAFADELTMEILKHLVAEMKHDWEVLVNREAAQMLKQQQEQLAQMQQIRGIKTDLFAIERYVDEVVEELKCKLMLCP